MAEILSADVLITRATGEKKTEIVVSDFYQNYAGANYIEQKMYVELNTDELKTLISNLNECLNEMLKEYDVYGED